MPGHPAGSVRKALQPGSSLTTRCANPTPTIHMTSTIRRTLVRWAFASLLPCAVLQAHAGIAVPDAGEWARMSPQQQAQRREDIQRQLQQASPQERQRFRESLRERLESLTPEQRQGLIDSTRERWQAMTPEQRREITDERRRRVGEMSVRERRELLRERRALLEKMTPQERRALREKLQAE
ncbi:MAG: hypothetical protein DCF26_07110 [Burkholderiales bacterium]|nr:MAG: hypothetical protein DCF26_07110 [Burkholderiales bacterium]